MNQFDETVNTWCARFISFSPKFPHIVSLEIFPMDTIYQKILNPDEFKSLLRSTLINVHHNLAQHNPTVTVITQPGKDKTQIVVTPPRHYLEEEGILH